MIVDADKNEILRLIALLNGGSVPATSTKRKSKRPSQAAPVPSKQISKRRQDLTALTIKRKRLEEDLPQDQLFQLYQRLEQRIEQLERRFQQTSNMDPDDELLAQQQIPRSEAAPSKPAQPAGPSSLIPDNCTLSGGIQEGMIADILQLISSNLMTGIFTVMDEIVMIELFFEEGELYHAEGEDLSGESAFFVVMALEEGRFFFKETKELPEEKTISSKTQFLILEALRQVDEARAGQS